MFPKEYRLRKQKDFDYVFKRGRSFFVKEVGIKAVKNNFDYSRFAFIVSNKIAKKATERNKIKRRLREIARLLKPRVKTGFDLVLIARSGLSDLDYKMMEERVARCLEGLGLLG